MPCTLLSFIVLILGVAGPYRLGFVHLVFNLGVLHYF